MVGLIHKMFGSNAVAVCLILAILLGAGSASAVTFEHVCTSLAACDNDADFAFTLKLDDSVVSANGAYNTRRDGGAAFLGWTGASSVGDGFSISGGFSDVTDISAGMTFTFDDEGLLKDVIDNDLSFMNFIGTEGAITLREPIFALGEPFNVFTSRVDQIPPGPSDTTPIIANWQFAQTPPPPDGPSPIPLPAAAWMFLTALGGLGLFLRNGIGNRCQRAIVSNI